MIAREWLQRGLDAESPIDALTNCWRGFNRLYAANQNIGDERRKIRLYLDQTISPQDAHAILVKNDQACLYLLSKPVIDMRGTGRDTHSAIDAFLTKSEPKDKLAEIFMIIYQVRCNLEHGDKSPSANRDIELCRFSVPFVVEVLKRYA